LKVNLRRSLRRSFEEIGKHFLNIGVAIVVFAISQPIIKDEFSLKKSLIFAFIYLDNFYYSCIFDNNRR